MLAIRLVILACLATAFAFSPVSPPALAAPQPGSVYLAAGDSLAYGFLTDIATADPQCKAADAPGYVCVFYRYLKTLRPDVQLMNISIPGADSCVFLYGYPGPDNQCVGGIIKTAVPSQVDEIVAQLKAHPGQTSPITISIGGDDLNALLPAALADPTSVASKLPGVFSKLQTNLDKALSTIRAADANVPIIITTQYNAVGGLGSPPLPAGFGDIAANALNTLNGIIKSVAAKYNVTVADVAAAFAANPGGAVALTLVPSSVATGGLAAINIHPNPTGYQVMGQTVISAYNALGTPLSASPAVPALSVSLARTTVAVGAMQRVSGVTEPGVHLSILVRFPHAATVHRYVATAGARGSFHRVFAVGSRTGNGEVRVCATGARGTTTCSASLAYRVR